MLELYCKLLISGNPIAEQNACLDAGHDIYIVKTNFYNQDRVKNEFWCNSCRIIFRFIK
jgi:hypothetical protein